MIKILFSNSIIMNFDLSKDKDYIVTLMKDLRELKELSFNKYKATGNKGNLQDHLDACHDLALLQNNFSDLWLDVLGNKVA